MFCFGCESFEWNYRFIWLFFWLFLRNDQEPSNASGNFRRLYSERSMRSFLKLTGEKKVCFYVAILKMMVTRTIINTCERIGSHLVRDEPQHTRCIIGWKLVFALVTCMYSWYHDMQRVCISFWPFIPFRASSLTMYIHKWNANDLEIRNDRVKWLQCNLCASAIIIINEFLIGFLALL